MLLFHLAHGRLLANISQLREGLGGALGVLFMVGFVWGVVKIWGGADALSKGNPDGKAGIVAGIILAASAAIMGAFFYLFGLQDAILTPRF